MHREREDRERKRVMRGDRGGETRDIGDSGRASREDILSVRGKREGSICD